MAARSTVPARRPPGLPWPLPAELVARIEAVHGAAGRRWLDALPATCAALTADGALRLGPLLPGLTYHLVCEVRRADGRVAVLKLGPPHGAQRGEIAALRAFDGRGSARLLAADPGRGALLVERLRPGRPLAERLGPAGEGDDAATAAAAELMRCLWPAPPPDPAPFSTVRDWGRGFRRMRRRFGGGSGPLPAALADRAERLFEALVASSAPDRLLHGDLHHFNILSHGRGWRAIDPKGLLGEPAYETGALLRNPWPTLGGWPSPARVLDRRLSILAERLGFDRQRILGWGIAQALLAAWWSLEDGTGDGAFAVAVAGWLTELEAAP